MSGRAGFTLLEAAAAIGIGSLVLGLAGAGLSALLRLQAGGPPGQVVDLACDRLRRDLAAGARSEGAELVAGGARWSMPPARDGRPVAGLAAIAWRRDGGAWEAVLTPVAGPPRVVRVEDPR